MTQISNAIMEAPVASRADRAPAPASNASFLFKLVFAKLIIVAVIATLVTLSI